MILNKSVTPSENEVSIKTYHCSTFSSFIFGLEADGFIEVTTKRLLFQAIGKGTSKNSIIHSEVSLSEVVGMDIYKGKGFNLSRLLLGLILLSLIVVFSSLIVDTVLTSFIEDATIYQVVIWVLFGATIYFVYTKSDKSKSNGEVKSGKDNSLFEFALLSVALGILAPLAKNVASYYQSYGSAKLAIPLFLILLIYALIKFAKKAAFSLAIYSRGGTSTIVRITGTSPMGSGIGSVKAKPGPDSELVLMELGALIYEIQEIGDKAVDKWRIKS